MSEYFLAWENFYTPKFHMILNDFPKSFDFVQQIYNIIYYFNYNEMFSVVAKLTAGLTWRRTGGVERRNMYFYSSI